MKIRDEIIEISKYQRNVMRAEAIASIASSLEYYKKSYTEDLNSLADKLDAMENEARDNADAPLVDENGYVNWQYENTYNEYIKTQEKLGVIGKVFDSLDKMFSK